MKSTCGHRSKPIRRGLCNRCYQREYYWLKRKAGNQCKPMELRAKLVAALSSGRSGGYSGAIDLN